MTKAAIYARLSTGDPDDGTSLDRQVRHCETYCNEHGYTIVVERREVVSGAFVLSRSGYGELLDLASAGEIEIIVADIPDRLGRGDAIAKCELLAELNGAQVEYARAHNKETIEGFTQHAVDQLVSGIERLNIARRTMEGRREIARRGGIVGVGQAPYGYRYTRNYDDRGNKTVTIEIEENEATIIRKIFEWSAEGLSNHQVTLRLNAERVPTQKGGIWHRSTVRKMLRNTAYIGEWHYGRRDTKTLDVIEGPKTRTIERDDWIKVEIPALVDKETFNIVQERMSERLYRGARASEREYLLKSRLFCGLCGLRMQGCTHSMTRKDGTRYLYYRCPNNHRRDRTHCDTGGVRADKIDAVVWDKIADLLLSDDDSITDILRRRHEESERARKLLQVTVAGLETELAKLQEQTNRLLDLYLSSDIEKETYRERQAGLEKEADRLRTEVDGYREQLVAQDTANIAELEELDALRRRLSEGLEQMDFEGKRRVLDILRVECTYYHETKEVVVNGVLGCYRVTPGSRTWLILRTRCS
jgi:site-specific DNA recombinase